ncbi:TRAP transporter small permease [Billgrantia saliphila]|uniref:TRAP transporter small permease n=1 Tax=Billgrantia saliphila TaxID=1848458 RepID=UPI000CE4E6D2|nr:TRAP transporter small permease [Halomonas saliphila]
MSQDSLPPEAASIDPFEDDDFDYKAYGWEDWPTLVVFWALAAVVFLQFFSRYVLGSSVGWTEEIARYLLIVVGFLGSAMAARKNSHIAVEFFYRYMPGGVGRVMSMLVDIGRTVFYAAGVWISYGLAAKTNAMMVSIDVPKDVIYYIVMVGFLLMLVRSVQVTIRHWREGESELTTAKDR